MRYVRGLKTEERFLGFFYVSFNKSVDKLANKIILVLKENNTKNKLVSQTYDGASVMAGHHCGVQTLVHQQCPQAIFMHWVVCK